MNIIKKRFFLKQINETLNCPKKPEDFQINMKFYSNSATKN